MKINRLNSLESYAADGHFDMTCLRVQGHAASPAANSWVGLSWLLPRGHTALTSSPLEKIYVVLEGTLTISDGETEQDLGRFDSCYFAPGESRQLMNRTNVPAAVLLVMPYPGTKT